ncbi:MAG: putative hydrolase (HD domain), partial [uncultured Gemmatimonadetes bacterium]
ARPSQPRRSARADARARGKRKPAPPHVRGRGRLPRLRPHLRRRRGQLWPGRAASRLRLRALARRAPAARRRDAAGARIPRTDRPRHPGPLLRPHRRGARVAPGAHPSRLRRDHGPGHRRRPGAAQPLGDGPGGEVGAQEDEGQAVRRRRRPRRREAGCRGAGRGARRTRAVRHRSHARRGPRAGVGGPGL